MKFGWHGVIHIDFHIRSIFVIIIPNHSIQAHEGNGRFGGHSISYRMGKNIYGWFFKKKRAIKTSMDITGILIQVKLGKRIIQMRGGGCGNKIFGSIAVCIWNKTGIIIKIDLIYRSSRPERPSFFNSYFSDPIPQRII